MRQPTPSLRVAVSSARTHTRTSLHAPCLIPASCTASFALFLAPPPAAAALAMSTSSGAAASPEAPVQIHIALPKGHMQENVFALLAEAGLKVSLSNNRGYRPTLPLRNYDVKLLKPQNILGMLAAGTRDVGFAGHDWQQELGADVVQVLDTELDPVRIVAASPDVAIMAKGGLGGRTIIVASEYEQLTRRWLERQGKPYTFLRAYGATESLPPEDADVIVDNAATGATLKANQLEVFDTLLNSTTRLFASKAAWADPAKRARIEELALLLRSVLDARKRVLVTFNCAADKLEALLAFLPACVAARAHTLTRHTPSLVSCHARPAPPLPPRARAA